MARRKDGRPRTIPADLTEGFGVAGILARLEVLEEDERQTEEDRA